MDGGVHYLAQIVRRYVGSHTHGNPGRTVEQQVGDLCGKNNWLVDTAIEVGLPIDRALPKLAEEYIRVFSEFRLGVSHGCEGFRIVGTTPVPLTIDQGIAIGEVLCHQDHGFVGCTIPVRVEFTDNITNGSR